MTPLSFSIDSEYVKYLADIHIKNNKGICRYCLFPIKLKVDRKRIITHYKKRIDGDKCYGSGKLDYTHRKIAMLIGEN